MKLKDFYSKYIKGNIRFYLLVLIATLFVGATFTSADFFTAPTHTFKDTFILFSQWGILVAALFTVIYLIALNKYVFAVIYPLMVFFSSVLTYFRYATGAILTTMMLDATLDNDARTSLEQISWSMALLVLSSLAISILLVVYRFKKVKLQYPWGNGIIALGLFLLMFNIPRIQAPLQERIPFNMYYMTVRMFEERQEAIKVREPLPAVTSCSDSDSLKIVFILGESLRFDHLGFNGYERNTTPYLSKEDIVSFPNIYSEYTYTIRSVPHILTRADSLNPNYAYTERSFIDLFNQCNYNTVWLTNQESAKSYIYFMNECDTLIYANADKSSYVFDKWVDGELLPYFDEFLEPNESNQFFLMHTIGSHWYFNAHFTDEFQVYNPITKSRIINSNTVEEIFNSYDNSILYMDYFIYEVINRLRDMNAVVVYLSDHGEAMGEDGIWLHATETEFAHRPGCFVWLSEQYKEKNPEKYLSLQKNKDNFYRSDFLFHTILDAAGIESPAVEQTHSLFYERMDSNP